MTKSFFKPRTLLSNPDRFNFTKKNDDLIFLLSLKNFPTFVLKYII